MEENQFMERTVITGMIISTELLKQIKKDYRTKLMPSVMAKKIAGWCMAHFNKYGVAPGAKIKDIYFENLRKKKISKDDAEDIENILSSLSEDYEAAAYTEDDLKYLIDQTKEFFKSKKLEEHANKILEQIQEDNIPEAETIASNFKHVADEENPVMDFSKEEALNNVGKAFAETQVPLFKYPKALGEFWNHQFVRGAFIAILAAEKRGKTWILMDMATRAVKAGRNVAFFQAGDMTEGQQLRRFCIHLAKTSDSEKYCGTFFVPVRDCLRNQINMCDNPDRESSFGPFEGKDKTIKYTITFQELREAYADNKDYKPCFNCTDYSAFCLGTPWLKQVTVDTPLNEKMAKKLFYENFIKWKRRLMLSSHSNGTLSVNGIKSLLSDWKKDNGFIPDVIIIDYADLLVPNEKQEFRHQQNEIWKNLRNLSQEAVDGIQPLVVTATQADAKSYEVNTLSMKNFSEDKRKWSHVTFGAGLNQDPKGREKQIGVLRINEIVSREGESGGEVTVLQSLRQGIPILTSYF